MNPTGTIHISELELAETIARKYYVFAQLGPTQEQMPWLASNNMATVS